MSEQFISEAIKPVLDMVDTQSLSAGTPGLPKEFIWRKERVLITAVLRTWRTTGPCRHGSDEQYARKHWFEVMTAQQGTMKIYFDRTTLGRTKERGWWLYTINK